MHHTLALLQHCERRLAHRQQDALLLYAPPLAHECWQAAARRKAWTFNTDSLLLAVADGAAASPQPALASRSYLAALQRSAAESPHTALPTLAHQAHRAWQAEPRPRTSTGSATAGSATTLAALALHGPQVCAVNLGDSRIWRLRRSNAGWQCQQLSHDHTLWQQMVDAGEVEDPHATPPSCYQDLTHCLTLGDAQAGMSDLHVWQGSAQPGDVFVLATDGLHGMVADLDLAAQWQACGTAEGFVLQLYRLWRRAGGGDDLSLITLHIGTRSPIQESPAPCAAPEKTPSPPTGCNAA